MGHRFLAPVLALAMSVAGCTHAQAPKARMAGEILAISGVVGLIGGALLSRYTSSHTAEVMGSFSIMSALGITLYAIGEQTDPMTDAVPETPEQTHRRWAKILTERAAGAAREGNCMRVQHLEKRVAGYNHDVHDFVLMRDPIIVRCLEAPAPAITPEAESRTLPDGIDPGPVHH